MPSQIARCRFCGGNSVYFYGSLPNAYGYSHLCDQGERREIVKVDCLDAEAARQHWNARNALDAQEEGGGALTLAPVDIPAFSFTPRGRRAVNVQPPPILDHELNIVEVEIGYAENRPYVCNGLQGHYEESVKLRARVEPGQTADQVIQRLHQIAVQTVENAQAIHAEEVQYKQAVEAFGNDSTNNPSYRSSPSYRSFNIGAIVDP